MSERSINEALRKVWDHAAAASAAVATHDVPRAQSNEAASRAWKAAVEAFAAEDISDLARSMKGELATLFIDLGALVRQRRKQKAPADAAAPAPALLPPLARLAKLAEVLRSVSSIQTKGAAEAIIEAIDRDSSAVGIDLSAALNDARARLQDPSLYEGGGLHENSGHRRAISGVIIKGIVERLAELPAVEVDGQ